MGKFVPAPQFCQWDVWQDDSGKFDQSQVDRAILLDIRRVLQQLLAIFECANARDIPKQLRAINRNTRKKIRKHGH